MKNLDSLILITLLFYGVALLVAGFAKDIERLMINGMIIMALAIILRLVGIQKIIPIQFPNSISEISRNLFAVFRNLFKKKENCYEIATIVALFIMAMLISSYYISSFLSADINPLVVTKYGQRINAIIDLIVYKIIPVILPFVYPFTVFFSILMVINYCILRLGIGRKTSLLLISFLMISSIQLDHFIPYFGRYYERMPVLMCVILLLCLLVIRPFKPGWTISMATFSGFVIGLGLSIRADFIQFLPIFGITLFFLLPVNFLSYIRTKIVSFLLLLMAAFLSYSMCRGDCTGAFQNTTFHKSEERRGSA